MGMNTSRWLVVALMICTAGALALANFFFWPPVQVSSAKSVMEGQALTFRFGAPLKQGIQADEFKVKDLLNQDVPAEMTLSESRDALQVEGLEEGSYELQIPKNAFRGWNRQADSKISFTVFKTVGAVTSIEKIKEFFEDAVKRDRVAFYAESESMENASEDKASAQGGAGGHSETNVQVEGVDEADLVKTDGKFIYDITDNERLVITDIRQAGKPAVASVTDFRNDFYPRELYTDGDLLVVTGGKSLARQEAELSKNRKASKDMIMPMQELAVIRIYDVSDREQPKLLRETGAEGYTVATRKIGDIVYLVTNNQPFFYGQELPEAVDLLPRVYDNKDGIQPIDIDRVSILPGAMEPSYSVITALDIRSSGEEAVKTEAYLGSGEQLYMSKDHLYLTSGLYSEHMTDSEVFKFALDGLSVDFVASTQMKGTLLNQFSMDEHDGFFRAVTTEENLWDEKNTAKNHLFIFDENLKLTGSVEDLALNERIYSARFMGDKAYMVTFRETDPLFVIDVADPSAPEVLGELKIPGFSNYLHPLDEGHLIGLGYETTAKKNPAGGEPIIQTGGMKLSLFDVTDFANPKEMDTEIIGGQGTYSPAQHDHHAMFIHPEKHLYGFPVSIWKETGADGYIDYERGGAMLFEITVEDGIRQVADLTAGNQNDYSEWEKEVQRLLYSGDALYTVAAKEIKSYSLDGYAELGTFAK